MHAAAATVLVAAAALSLWLMRFSRRLLAWRLLALGFVLLAGSVVLEFVHEHVVPWVFWGAAGDTALLAAAMLLAAGLALIRPIFLEYRRAQEVLERAGREWQLAFDGVHDPVFLHDAKLRIVRANRAYCARAGKPLEKVVGKPYWEVFPKRSEPLPACRRAMQEAAAAAAEEEEEEEVELQSGEVFNSRSFAVRDAGGASLYSFHILTDITEKRRAEAALRENEARLQTITDEVRDAIMMIDDAGRIEFWNPGAEAMFGYAREEALGRDIGELIVPPRLREDHRRGMEQFRRTGTGAIIGRRMELPALRKDGVEFWSAHMISAVQIGGRWRAIGIARDITERKEAESQLRISEQRYRQILRTTTDGFWIADIEGRILEVNDAYCRMTGYSRDELLRMRIPDVEAQETPDETVRHIEEIRTQGLTRFETHHRCKDGQLLDIEVSVEYGPDAVSGPVFLRDITERKRAEKTLRDSEERLRGITERNVDGILVVDEEGRVRLSNPAAQAMFGRTAAELDRQSFGLPLTAGEVAEIELMRREGPLSVEMRVVPTEWDGAPARLVVLHDLAERKRTEAARAEAAMRLRRTLESTVAAIAATVEMRDPYTAGHQRRVAALAVAIARELGLAEEQIEGLHLAGTVHDLGKIHIPAEILVKPGRLSEIEFGLIKLHPQAGYEILKDVEFPWPIAQIVYQHHERLDGSGYPNGLKGEAILEEAKIMTVADVVEAMSSHRPYRPALGTELALAHVVEKRGAWYDPHAVDACLRLFREKGYTLGQ